jgi:hypothetical protein
MATVEMYAIATGQADMLAGNKNQVGDQFGDRGFSSGAGHANHRDAAAFVRSKQAVDNCLADRAWLADAWTQVHQQAGAGVDFDDGTALRRQGFRNVFANQIDARDVETHDARRE